MPFLNSMDIQIHYDSSWNTEFGQAPINAIKVHVQTWYCMPSLGAKIKFNVSIIT